MNETLPFQPHSPTSKAAAVSMTPHAPTLKQRVLHYIEKHGPVTDEEIALGLAMNPSTARPRRIELSRAGLIRIAGDRPTASGRKAVLWELKG